MEMASPDLEKQGFLAVVFVNREYNGQPDPCGHAQKTLLINRKFLVFKLKRYRKSKILY
jgi:hypothetical protein